MSQTHREYFNQLANTWDTKMPSDPTLIEYLKRFGISKGETVLDIGAGTGRMTEHLTELVGQEGLVVMHDFAEEMLIQGKDKFTGSPVFPVCNDVSFLAFKDETFDKILCFSAFPHFINPLLALKEMFRTIKSHGKLLVLHLKDSLAMNNFHANLNGVVQKDRLPSTEELQSTMTTLGFQPVHINEQTELYWVEMAKP